MGLFDWNKSSPQPPTPSPAPPPVTEPLPVEIPAEAKAQFSKVEEETQRTKPIVDFIDSSVTYGVQLPEGGLFKAYIPQFMYRPLFGYPRDTDTVLLRKLGANAYIHSIISTIQYQVSTCPWDIQVKTGLEDLDEVTSGRLEEKKKLIKNFLRNPNGNEESFEHILRMIIRDILELDSGVIVKVYNRKGQLSEIYARDGASFLKNPDLYGRIGIRAEYIPWHMWIPDQAAGLYSTKMISADKQTVQAVAEKAAYWQYSWSYGSIPVPFGKREIMWFEAFPRTENIYGRSPLEVLGDVLYILLYGTAQNLDMYLNNNIPEGVISLIGAEQPHINAFKAQFRNNFTERDVFNNVRKKWYSYPVTNQKIEFTPFMLNNAHLDVLQQQPWFWKLALACFGVTPSEMGFTEDSNKATEIAQQAVSKRRAIAPLLKLIEYVMTSQLIETDFDAPELEFKFDDYDISLDLQRHDLYEKQLRLNLATVNEIREKEGKPPLKDGDMTSFQQQQQISASNGADRGQDDPARNNKDNQEQLRKEEKDIERKSVPVEKLSPEQVALDKAFSQQLNDISEEIAKIIHEG